MALTVPPAPSSSFSEFGWIFHNNHLDSSIYHDDDMMEFSDSSADYQTTPPHNQICEQQQQVSPAVCKSPSAIYPENTSTHVMLSFHVC